VRLPSWNGKGPGKTSFLQFVDFPLIIYSLDIQMRVLDNFISPIPDFEGDILILAIPILAWTPSAELANDASVGPSARSLRTQAGKRKAAATLPPPKKAKKVMGKRSGGIKIIDPSPKASVTWTPPKGPQGKFTMRQSNRYSLHNFSFFLELHCNSAFCAGLRKISNRMLL
jgi:hypothetical protein